MKKNEIIKIGKEEFTLCKYFNPYVRCMDLYDAYMKPSQIKKNIWEYWRNWFHENKEGFNDFYRNWFIQLLPIPSCWKNNC